MLISVFPKGFLREMIVDRTMTVFDWITTARQLPPVDGLELHADFFWQTDDGYLDRVGDTLAAAGFVMPMVCVSPDFVNPDPEIRKRELDREIDMIRIAGRIGTDNATVRVLSGMARPEVPLEQGLDWASEAILSLIPIAKEHGVTLALENHYKASTWEYPEFAQRREVYLELLSRIDERAAFGVQFDPSNAITAGLDSAKFLEEVIDRVVSMQASDRFLSDGATLDELRLADGTIGYSPALQHGVIGRGLNDYPRIFRTLVNAGYDGWISIEDGVNGMSEMADSIDFLTDARDRYFGGSRANRIATLERARAAAAPVAR
jgi:sugar phosphate isomerase/epimerase